MAVVAGRLAGRLLGPDWRSGVIGKLLAASWRRGVTGGSRPWLVIGGVAVLLGLSRREKQPRVVFSQPLRPGETLVLSAQEADAVLVDR